MRLKRTRKFKTNRKLKLIINFIAVCYLAIMMIGYISSSTEAYFVGTDNQNLNIQAGEWWDGSELEFLPPTYTENECPNFGVVSVKVKNKGFTMIGPTNYEVIANGNVVESGEINPINADGESILEFNANEQGTYKFKLLQRPYYDDNYETRTELHSSSIVVDCYESEEPEADKEDITEDTEKEIELDESNDKVENQEKDEVGKDESDIAKDSKESPKEEKGEPSSSDTDNTSEKETNSDDKKTINEPVKETEKPESSKETQKTSTEHAEPDETEEEKGNE